jgi:AcrR family transcriptional regulator
LLVPPLDRGVAEEARRAAQPTDAVEPADEVDGRKVRGMRNRDAVVDAILFLLGDGNLNPTAREIADRANVSLRSVFRHFEDLDSLFLAAIERQAERTAHLYEPPVSVGDREARTASLVTRRRKLYEAIFEVRRGWMLRYYDQPRVSAILDEIYRALYSQVVTLYSQDVDGLTASQRRELFDAIDAATSFDTWAHLRSHRGLSATRSAAVVKRTVLTLLADALGD